MTTFLTMAYIIVVNPITLAQAGVPAEGVMIATCLAAAIGSLMMGVFTNYPFGLAPGMGLNACLEWALSGRRRWRPCSCLGHFFWFSL